MFYLRHPLGRFTCTQCGAKYQHDRPWQYYVISVIYVLAVIGFAAAIIFTMTHFNSNAFLISLVYWGWLVFMSLLWFYFDHKYESTLPTRLR